MGDPVLSAWQEAGTELTMLPSGIEVRLEPVPVAEMVRTGFLPGQLQAMALRFASSDGVQPQAMSAEELAHWDALQLQMISRWVSAVRWVCECPECAQRRTEPMPEQPYHLDPEKLAANPPAIPRVDLAALVDLVCFIRSPRQVDALSRVVHGQLDSEEAARIVEAERANTVAGWESFRRGGPGLEALGAGDGLPGAAQPAAGAHAPGAGVPAGRGPRRKGVAGTSRRRRGG